MIASNSAGSKSKALQSNLSQLQFLQEHDPSNLFLLTFAETHMYLQAQMISHIGEEHLLKSHFLYVFLARSGAAEL